MTARHDAKIPPVRLSQSLLDAVRRRASKRGETFSDVVRRGLQDYVDAEGDQVDLEDFLPPRRPHRLERSAPLKGGKS